MEEMYLPIVLKDGGKLPTYGSVDSAGMDLCSTESFILAPMKRKAIGTGLFMAIPRGHEGQVRPRSGLAAKFGITVLNTPGTVDSDYRGEVKVILINLGEEPFEIKKGDRIAQMVMSEVVQMTPDSVLLLDDTERGDGGFGSTGIK